MILEEEHPENFAQLADPYFATKAMSSIYFFFAIIFFMICVKRSIARKRLPLPPSPPADPIIGHLRILPHSDQGNVFYALSKKYGDVMYLRIPGRSFLILNSLQAATDLLDKRSAIYSDRVRLVIFEIMGWIRNLGQMQYGKQFQKHRRLLGQYFNRKECETYQGIQLDETQILLQNFVSSPENFDSHLRRYATAVIMKITYGHDIVSDDDPYVKIAHEATETLINCGPPGGTPVDLMPFLEYFPPWFPGTFYAFKAREYNPVISRLHDFPYESVKEQMAEGTEKPSYLSFHLKRLQKGGLEDPDELIDIKGSAAVMYGAGAETTWSTLSIFFLALVLHPEFQVRAQQEIDAVLGVGRLPRFEDRASLPYVECILQESYRWNNAAPIGMPHRVMEDDIYNGMFIPKGTVVIANSRGILLDDCSTRRVYESGANSLSEKAT